MLDYIMSDSEVKTLGREGERWVNVYKGERGYYYGIDWLTKEGARRSERAGRASWSVPVYRIRVRGK